MFLKLTKLKIRVTCFENNKQTLVIFLNLHVCPLSFKNFINLKYNFPST